MNTMLYPAIFHTEDVGYSVYVPDIQGCVSEGDTLEEAYENVFDALGLCLDYLNDNQLNVPTPSKPSDIKLKEDEFVAFVQFDPVRYAKKHNTKAVKKTLSIPSWLNELAEEQNVNFSGVLQSALKDKLGVN